MFVRQFPLRKPAYLEPAAEFLRLFSIVLHLCSKAGLCNEQPRSNIERTETSFPSYQFELQAFVTMLVVFTFVSHRPANQGAVTRYRIRQFHVFKADPFVA
jgi:hypothetical protein